MKKINPDLILLFVALIWGTGFIATEYAIDAGMAAIVIMALRFSVAAIILFVFNAKDIANIEKREWIRGSIAGVFLFFGFYFQTIGQVMTTVSNSAFITATNVVFVPFIVWAITRKKPKNKIFILALLTFIGIAVLTVSWQGQVSFNFGDLFVFIGAIMFAFHIAYLSIAVSGNDAKRITFIQMSVAALLSIIGMGLSDMSTLSNTDFASAIPAVLFLGLFSTCLCFFLQTSAQKRTSPSKTGIILSTESFFGTLFSLLLGIEPLTLKIVIGGIIIMFSVIMTEVDLGFLPVKKTSNVEE